MTDDLYKESQKGLMLIEKAIEKLLLIESEGLRNCEIAHILGLKSSHEGKQPNFLTFSVLGLMMEKGTVKKIKNGSKVLYKICIKV